jgi:protein subunit release factor B
MGRGSYGCGCAPTADLLHRSLSVVSKDFLNFRYSRSSGPGGQHVNKVNTKVDCRFVVKSAAWLTLEEREQLVQRHSNRINAQGELVVVSQASRSQADNLNDCIRKVQELIDSLAKNYGTRKFSKRKRTVENNSRQENTQQRSPPPGKNVKPQRTKKGKTRMWVWG